MKRVSRWFFDCDMGRLDCWRSGLYKTKKEARELGWTEKDGNTRCPCCSYREDKDDNTK